MTFVKSSAYGNHVRMRRGTYTPVKINDAFKRSGKELVKANAYAKMIKDAFEPFRQDFKDGTLWQRLVSGFKYAFAEGNGVDYSFLKGFQFHHKHALHSVAATSLQTKIDTKKKMLRLSLQLNTHFNNKKPAINGYALSIIVAFLTTKKKKTDVSYTNFPLTRLKNAPSHYNTDLTLPKEYDAILICIKLNGYTDDTPTLNERGQGMAIVEVVKD